MARKKILCADNSAWKKAIDAFGQAEKPVIKVEGCKTIPDKTEKTKKPRKPYQRKRLTMRERTNVWHDALAKAGKLQPKATESPMDWWSLSVPDYDKSIVIPMQVTEGKAMKYNPDTANVVTRKQQDMEDKWLPEAELEVKLYHLMILAEKFPTI